MNLAMRSHCIRNPLHLLLLLQTAVNKIKTYRRKNRGGVLALLKSLETRKRQQLRLWKQPMNPRKPLDLKPIQFHQLCALVKTILQQEPTIDDAEWKARALDTMAKWGFQAPRADVLVQAMTQVEHALQQTIGPRRLARPVPSPAQPEATEPRAPEPKGRTHRPAGWDIVVKLMADLRFSSSCVPSLPAPSGPTETLAITEEVALHEFWRQIGEGTDRLRLLRAFAEIAIVRPDDWNPAEIRAHAGDHNLTANGCFACGNKPSHWHHVIQVQHGGSNYLRNRVALCEVCHREVHPWLPQKSRRVEGWTHIGGCSPAEFGDVMKKAIA